ncbi:MAG: TerC family protein [Hyphomicrobium sp.]|uniref:TerC family protein n=1 Tax=Hyphomicrobium sp. TaxID=82 RepID=UPI00132C1ACF|nr:TerC family protein [Hyphomicrobium sp.]KAB2943461.1 MAG: TerC family protein [Hyphomicrobium sp.]MBZ0210700.1 TerC family protein [Hyphomicrobium sp.]MCZ7595006.1 TerC family protein [Hyphomicrobium sp.]
MDWLLQDLGTMLSVVIEEAGHLLSPEWYRQNFFALINITMIDLVLAGDNAIIVGLAASRVPKEIRAKVIFWGIAAAVVLRVFFAAVTVQLLAIIGLTLAGGLLLLWVCWKMYLQITTGSQHTDIEPGEPVQNGELGFWTAVGLITIADVSMSLDNVLAVAGAAKGSTLVLVIGLAVAIVLMAVASHYIAELLVKYPWITWIGLLIILWVALGMIYEGSHEVTCKAFNFGCSETLWEGILHRLGLASPPTPVPAPAP